MDAYHAIDSFLAAMVRAKEIPMTDSSTGTEQTESEKDAKER